MIAYIFVLINLLQMQFKVIDGFTAADLIKDPKTTYKNSLTFNMSTVYVLGDASFLVTPLNPYSESIIIYSESFLNKCINDEYFPVVDSSNKFYVDNKPVIDDFLNQKGKLITDLLSSVGSKSTPESITPGEVDEIYSQLKKKKNFKKERLAFLALVGQRIISVNPHLKWGLLKNKQLLNPVVSLILIKDDSKKTYINLQDMVYGKYGYLGLATIEQQAKLSELVGNEIEEVVDLF